jgi:hypothetical protein|mmetsp:Transcript_20452/g.27640  ORF Transcript_20452/g.27640 Transcript_20452/m.27640 type:complete len:243 (+) Transcript_20452:3089-3817(+)
MTTWKHEGLSYSTLRSLLPLGLHLLVLNTIIRATNETINTTQFWELQSWVALTVWMRVILTYLGEIRELSWLVGLIKYTMTSTGYFLVVFLVGVTAFADSFNALDQEILLEGKRFEGLNLSPEDYKAAQISMLSTMSFSENFKHWLSIWQYSFRAGIGDFMDDANLYGYVDWMIFFLMVFFLIILMLNLLISVIAEAQAEYTDARIQSTYREKAQQIRQKGYSFFWAFYKAESDPSSVLYVV